jgi:hypothetical protein
MGLNICIVGFPNFKLIIVDGENHYTSCILCQLSSVGSIIAQACFSLKEQLKEKEPFDQILAQEESKEIEK